MSILLPETIPIYSLQWFVADCFQTLIRHPFNVSWRQASSRSVPHANWFPELHCLAYKTHSRYLGGVCRVLGISICCISPFSNAWSRGKLQGVRVWLSCDCKRHWDTFLWKIFSQLNRPGWTVSRAVASRFRVIRERYPRVEPELVLGYEFTDIKYFKGTEGMVTSPLVFGTLSTFPVIDSGRSAQPERLAAMNVARD